MTKTAIWRSPSDSAKLTGVPRKPRTDAAGAIQHVIARGNAGSLIVVDDDDRRTLINALASCSTLSEPA